MIKIDLSKALETKEKPPRKVWVVGTTKGAIDYLIIKIGKNKYAPSMHAHPPGVYSAEETSGLVRGNLAIRNSE